MARDMIGVVATAMTELDYTPPTRIHLHNDPQVAVDLQSLSDGAKSVSGLQLGHGVFGRQWTESQLSIITPSADSPINKHFLNSLNAIPEHPEFYPRVQGIVLHV